MPDAGGAGLPLDWLVWVGGEDLDLDDSDGWAGGDGGAEEVGGDELGGGGIGGGGDCCCDSQACNSNIKLPINAGRNTAFIALPGTWLDCRPEKLKFN